MANLRFSFDRGSYGYRFDWEGEKVIIKAVGAAKVAIDECMAIAVEHARANHPDYPPAGPAFGRYANRTWQMTEHIKILQYASAPGSVEWDGRFPWVHGEWGVEAAPVREDINITNSQHKYVATTTGQIKGTALDRAIFLEFGTAKALPRPFLYPAWDESKVQMPRLFREAYAAMGGGSVSGGLADFIRFVRS